MKKVAQTMKPFPRITYTNLGENRNCFLKLTVKTLYTDDTQNWNRSENRRPNGQTNTRDIVNSYLLVAFQQ